MGFVKDAKDRWDAKTPEFFEKLKKFAISLGTSSTAIWIADETMSLNLHETIMEVCKYLIAFSAAMGVTSQLTKDNNP